MLFVYQVKNCPMYKHNLALWTSNTYWIYILLWFIHTFVLRFPFSKYFNHYKMRLISWEFYEDPNTKRKLYYLFYSDEIQGSHTFLRGHDFWDYNLKCWIVVNRIVCLLQQPHLSQNYIIQETHKNKFSFLYIVSTNIYTFTTVYIVNILMFLVQ